MTLKVKLLLITLLISWTLPLVAHQNSKDISEGVIEEKDKICYIVSPADRYQIRKEDYHIVSQFVKEHNTKKVSAELTRKHHSDLWTIKSLKER